jgi:hypothetical protein
MAQDHRDKIPADENEAHQATGPYYLRTLQTLKNCCKHKEIIM